MSGVTSDYTFAQVPEDLLFDPKIDHLAVRIYGVLARYGQTPNRCFPSDATIAARIGVEPRSVQRPLRVLEEAGWIARVPRQDKLNTRAGFHVYMTPFGGGKGRVDEREGRAQERDPRAEEREGVALRSATGSRTPARQRTRASEREPDEREREVPDVPPETASLVPAVISKPPVKERNHAALAKLPKSVDPEDVKALCLHLCERMYRHHGGPGKATVTPNWVSEMGRLLNSGPKDVDGYVPTATEVHSMIDSIFDHLNEPQGNGTFCWATVIQSPGNLRKKWMAVSGALRVQGPRVAQSDVLAAMDKLDRMGVRR